MFDNFKKQSLSQFIFLDFQGFSAQGPLPPQTKKEENLWLLSVVSFGSPGDGTGRLPHHNLDFFRRFM
jgi:hypothetical protein